MSPVVGTAAPWPVLTLNLGSSTLKFGLYKVQPGVAQAWLQGWFEPASALFVVQDARGQTLVHETLPSAGLPAALARLQLCLAQGHAPTPRAVAHRLVHGGPHVRQHALITPDVLAQLNQAAPWAPVHLPAALACMQHTMQAWPGVPQLGCLDTCFHAQMPALASVLPLPRALRAQGFVRYGFHGLSCESIVRQLAAHGVPHRLLIAHLGQGASVTAVQAGVSIDTSMGATPNGGLVMGSRCGDIDPGTLVLLMRQQGLGAQAMEQLIDQQSGLLGISGLSADLRALHDAAATQPDAQLAVDMFSYSAAKHLAAMAAVLQGVDAIVFTGGIGQHDARVRGAICNRLGFMGVQLDAALNQQGAAGLVSRPASACAVWVLPSLEDEQMALWVPGLCGAVG